MSDHVPAVPVVRVVLVDDHAVVRHGLSQLLSASAGVEVVGSAADGAEAVDLARRLRPDVVVMDLQMPGVDGVQATRAVVAEGLAEVLVLTSFSDSERIVAALDAGAVGYLLKDADPDVLVAGVHAVSRGESPLDPRAARQLLGSRQPSGGRLPGTGGPGVPPPGSRASTPAGLTRRELEVLGLVRAGLANKQIARRQGITDRTVKAHLTRVYAAIGVVDRTQAALWAERQGVEVPGASSDP